MHDKFKKLMDKQKKKGDGLSDMQKEAKMSVVKSMSDMASQAMRSGLKDGVAKKVSVMSDSDEGLKKGLEKAEEIIEQKPDIQELESEQEDEAYAESEESEEEEMSEEELDAKLQSLMALKEKLQAKKS
jgi:hypothetical protein